MLVTQNQPRLGAARCALVAALASALIAPTAAHADKPSAEQMRVFKQKVKEGSKYRDEGEYWRALESFEAARTILDHPKLVFSIGKLREKTGACTEARRIYADVLARPKLDDEVRVEVADQLRASDSCTPRATLEVTCSPEETQLQWGGEAVACATRQDVALGRGPLVASAPGYQEQRVDIPMQAGELVETSVSLEAAPVQPPVARAEVATSSSWMTYTAWGLMGTGAALAVGGLASDYTAQARSEEFVAANRAGDRELAQQLQSEAESAELRTVLLYSAGGALLAGGVVLWTLSGEDSEEEGASVRAEVGWVQGGASVRGVWHW